MWLFTGVWSTYWRLQSERNLSLPLLEAKIDNSFLISGETSCLLPISVLRFGLCCTCMYVLCMLSQLLCVAVQLPYCTQKILFACSPAHHLWPLHSSHPLFCNDLWTLKGGGVVYRVDHSTVFWESDSFKEKTNEGMIHIWFGLITSGSN